MDYQSYINEITSDIKNPLNCAFGDFELTQQCNFNCKMCFINNKNIDGLKSEQYIKYAKEAVENGLLELSLTGGEVFTRKDFFDIYDEIYKLGVLISIMTNGYLLDDKKIEHLYHKPPHNIYVTLYGTSNETYKKICGVDNGFTVVYNNIQKLINAGIRVVLQATLTVYNICDYEEMIKLGKVLNLPIRVNHRLFYPLDTAQNDINNIKKSQIDLSDTPDDLINSERNYITSTEIIKKCKALKNSFCITAKGKLQICQRCTYMSVNIDEKGLISALDYLRSKVEYFKIPKKCLQCNNSQFCDLCLGGIYQLKNGSTYPYECFCEFAKRKKKIMNIND